jgi:DNA-binding protein HU-beta
VTKEELINSVQRGTKNLSRRAVEDLVQATFGVLSKSIKKEGRFAYPGFGTFTVRYRKGRKGRNPKTGAMITIQPSKTVGFKPAPRIKKSL